MNKYYFVYKDSKGSWHTAINPTFIASHQWCRSIPVKVFKNDALLSDFLFRLNNYNESELAEKDLKLIQDYDLS